MSGLDGKAASFPRAGGNEGVGRVVEAGPASTLRKGDVVVASAPGAGTWATHVVAEGASFTKVEGAAPGSAGFPVETAAVAVGAPLTAKHLLASVALSAGDVLVQNNAASLVGQAVIQYAAAAGVQTVNIVSKAAVADWANAVYHLQVSGMANACWALLGAGALVPALACHATTLRAHSTTHPNSHPPHTPQGLGATIVVDDAYARTPAFAKLLADLPAPKLGLNGVGGAAFSSVAGALAPGATLVTYGGAPIKVASSALLRKGLTLTGFSLQRTLAALPKAARDAAVNAVIADVRGDKSGALGGRHRACGFVFGRQCYG